MRIPQGSCVRNTGKEKYFLLVQLCVLILPVIDGIVLLDFVLGNCRLVDVFLALIDTANFDKEITATASNTMLVSAAWGRRLQLETPPDVASDVAQPRHCAR